MSEVDEMIGLVGSRIKNLSNQEFDSLKERILELHSEENSASPLPRVADEEFEKSPTKFLIVTLHSCKSSPMAATEKS